MKNNKIILSALVFCFFSLAFFAAENRKYLETSTQGFVKSSGDYYQLSTFRLDISEAEKFEVPSGVKIYDKEGNLIPTAPNALTIGASIFIVFDSNGQTVKAIYELQNNQDIGKYNGPGAKAAGFTPKEWTEEGFIVISVMSDSQSIEIKPFDSDQNKTYNVFTLGYGGGAAWYDENDNKVSSFNNAFLKSGSNKIRITLREVNGNPLVVEVKKLPPQYMPEGMSLESWDGWNGVENGQAFTVNTYYGRVSAFSENDRTLTITRDDGKYKVYKVAGDAWIFNKSGKKGKYIPALGYETKVRYMVRTMDGKEEIIDARPVIINDDEEEPVDHKAGLNLKDGTGTIRSYNEKKKTVVIYDFDRAKSITFQIPDFVECYDKYGREYTMKDLSKTLGITYQFTKDGDTYTIITARESSK